MSKVFVGLDSGGTRTNVEVVVDGDDSQLRRYEATNEVLSGAMSPLQYASILSKILAPIESYWSADRLSEHEVYVFLGAAGFAESTREDFLEALRDVLPGFLGGAVVAGGAANDAVALLLGHSADGVVVAGTGSNVLTKDADGVLHQAGGHDWVAADYGAGFWIGLRAIRQACRDREAGLDTVLLGRLYEVYGIRAGHERRLIAKLRDLAVADASMKSEIARFAAAVCGAAERGDVEAQNIVKAEAEDLADSAASALRRRFERAHLQQGIQVVQCGGLFDNEGYRAAFEAQVQLRLRAGSDNPAVVEWMRVKTGGTAVMNLARELAATTDRILEVSPQFRPVVVRFN